MTDETEVTNNVMRHNYKELSELEKGQMKDVKDMGLMLHDYLSSMGESRELSIAKTKLEESVMWSGKHITK